MDDYETKDLQLAAGELAEAIAETDADLLARATPDQRAAQTAAREAVADYFDQLWDSLKLRGLDPGGNDDNPAYAAAAGLRDLTATLRGMAEESRYQADDDDDLDPAGAQGREAERRARLAHWLKTASIAELEAARETCNPADVLDLAEALAERGREARM